MAPGQRRFRLTLHYDGTRFFGWQMQPEVRTVQGELQATLERLTGAPRTVTGAGRTDRGVHATGQVAAVALPPRWSAATLLRALNATLPQDIWVAEAHVAPPGFHPRYDATAREYGYRLGLTVAARSPFHRPWCWPLARLTRRHRLGQGGRGCRSPARGGHAPAGREVLRRLRARRPGTPG